MINNIVEFITLSNLTDEEVSEKLNEGWQLHGINMLPIDVNSGPEFYNNGESLQYEKEFYFIKVKYIYGVDFGACRKSDISTEL